ncbi:hypothetical protein LSCM1_01036 [Leishmania martiniquensis]|uniref:Uncharacterized protein n=1 Tax=Leishmania martiniquensis TaxID=1580590 RepID=A0A836G5R5_9TRYP|nr:hypothetical protein LSCM1_01036 [Leishmania martiniquensis]
MAICAASTFADFLSDCADVVCADRFLVHHFISKIAVDDANVREPLPLFSRLFATGDTTSSLICGAVNLTRWVASTSTFEGKSSVATDGSDLYGIARYPAAPVSSSPTSWATPRHQWRLITLLTLVAASFGALCVDAAMLYWVLPKWRRLKQQAREAPIGKSEPAAP